MDKILAYANKVAQEAEINIEGIDFSPYDIETSYRKDNGELNAETQKKIEKQIKSFFVKKVKYIVKSPILHNGKRYAKGDDVTGTIAQKALDELLTIGAIEAGE